MKRKETIPSKGKGNLQPAGLLESKKAILRKAGERLLMEHAQSNCGHTSHFVNSPLIG